MNQNNTKDLIFGMGALIVSMIFCIVYHLSLLIGLISALIVFFFIGLKRKVSYKVLLNGAFSSAKVALKLSPVFLMIGVLTGIWRGCGTITYCVILGVKLISSNWFLLVTFIVSCLMSYALGSSVAVAGTVGVIFMSLAKSGNVNIMLTAGAIISGAYFGDRNSPSSTCANIVANVTDTDLLTNVKNMFVTSRLSLLFTGMIFLFLSFLNPLSTDTKEIIELLQKEHNLSLILLIPVLIIIVFPLLKIKISRSMQISTIVSIILCLFLQKESIYNTLMYCINGFKFQNPSLKTLNGGGFINFFELYLMTIISNMFSGLLDSSGLLIGIENMANSLENKLSRFPAVIISSILYAMLFYNKSVSIIMTSRTWKGIYKNNEKNLLAMDIENSAGIISGLVPWCVSTTGVNTILGVPFSVIIYSFYLYILPITYCLLRKYYIKKIS